MRNILKTYRTSRADGLFSHLSNKAGTVTVIVAVAITIIIGMTAIVLDLGKAYQRSAALQNAVDAGALATAKVMIDKNHWNDNDLKNAAESYVEKNDSAAENITYEKIEVGGVVRGVKVLAQEKVDYNFARVIGFDSVTINKSATAMVGALESALGIIPLGVDASVVTLGVRLPVLEIKGNMDDEYSNGWRGIVDLDGVNGGGASDYSDRLRNGYDGEVSVGQQLPLDPGVVSNPTLTAINERVNACTHTYSSCITTCTQGGNAHSKCTGAHYTYPCSRVVIVPVIKGIPGDTSKVEVSGFAVLVLEEVVAGEGAGENIVNGTFVKTVVPGDVEFNATVHDYGANGVRLVE